jgi:uncharacterized protein YajQ (UPF0234 family)
MIPSAFLFAVLAAAAPPASPASPREPNPLAPSLPLLTDEEEARLDGIIDRFIQQDIGALTGTEAQQALADFQRLGPDATLALIRALNRAARIETSCPAVLIAKKLAQIFRRTEDPELLQFARENIGLGVKQSRHQVVLKDLRLVCTIRQGQLARQGARLRTRDLTAKVSRQPSTDELAAAAGKEHGDKLREVLGQLSKRDGPAALGAIGTAAGGYDKQMAKFAQGLLEESLSRQSVSFLKDSMKDDRATVRAAAARVAGRRVLRLEGLIDLLSDEEADVRAAAHEALVRLNHGSDLGSFSDGDAVAQAEAVKRWRDWLLKQDGR